MTLEKLKRIAGDCDTTHVNDIIVEWWQDGELVARYKSRGPAADGSGTLFRVQQFRKAFDGRSIIHKTELTCLSDKDIDHLKAVAGAVVVTG